MDSIINTTYHYDYLQIYNNTKREEYIPVFVFYAVIIFFGIVGNSFAFLFYRFKARKTVSSFFLAMLAANDLLTSMVKSDKIYQLYVVGQFTNTIGCKVLIFVNHVFVLNSGFIIITMNIDRCQHVCRPFSKWGFTKRSARICLTILLSLSFAIGVSNLFVTDTVAYNIIMDNNVTITAYRCTYSRLDKHQIIITVFHMVDLLTVILTILSALVIYSLIAWTIANSKHNLKSIEFKTASSEAHCQKSKGKDDDNQIKFTPSDVQNISKCDPSSCTIETNVHSDTISQLNVNALDMNNYHISECSMPNGEQTNLQNAIYNANIDNRAHKKNNQTTRVRLPESLQINGNHGNGVTTHADITNNNRHHTSEIRITAMMFTMTLGTVVCVVPYFYVSLMGHEGMHEDEFEMTAKARLLRGSFAVYSTLNPYVIGIFYTEFRAFALGFIKKWMCCFCLRR